MVKKVLGSKLTDSNGIANINYSATGVGKFQIIAESGNLVSSSTDGYDVLFRDIGTLASYSNWNNSTTTNFSRNDEYTEVQPNDFSVFSSRTVNTNGATVVEFDANINYDGGWMSLRQGSSSVTNLSPQYLGTTVDEWHHYIIEVDGINYRAIVDGVERDWRTMSGVQTYDRFQISFNVDTGLIIRYKNFIMYKGD